MLPPPERNPAYMFLADLRHMHSCITRRPTNTMDWNVHVEKWPRRYILGSNFTNEHVEKMAERGGEYINGKHAKRG